MKTPYRKLSVSWCNMKNPYPKQLSVSYLQQISYTVVPSQSCWWDGYSFVSSPNTPHKFPYKGYCNIAYADIKEVKNTIQLAKIARIKNGDRTPIVVYKQFRIRYPHKRSYRGEESWYALNIDNKLFG